MLIVDADDVARRLDAIAAALAGGVDAIQLRDARVAGGALLAAATALRALTRMHRAQLVVNDRVDVALAADADGVHLPAASFPVATARALVGADRLVGRSTHAPAEAVAVLRGGADYVVLGPIFATPSKSVYGAPLGIEALAAVARAAPVLAIGGITPERAAAVRDTGAHGVAVIRAILDAPDPSAAAVALVAAVTRGGAARG